MPEQEQATRERLVYAYGETPHEEILERLPQEYDMRLNRADVLTILDALLDNSEAGMSLRASILAALEIHEV